MRWFGMVALDVAARRVAAFATSGRALARSPVARSCAARSFVVRHATAGGRSSAAVKQTEEPTDSAVQQKLDLNPPRGTRDFYPAEMRVRNWLFGRWREAAAASGFEEYDSPVLESEALYVRKAGEEVTQQLYNFEDKGGRRVALRPEMTPSLARMVMARRAALPLPLKWFSIPQCWRYERTTRGRRREHFQWNMDIWGVEGVEAEAELLSCMARFFESVGLGACDVGIKVNSRLVLAEVLSELMGVSADEDASRFAATCVLVDKLEKVEPAALYDDFGKLGIAPAAVEGLAKALTSGDGSFEALEALLKPDSPALAQLRTLRSLAEAYGIGDWIVYDASVVRGLAYYTGVVFECFDRAGELRAIAGGGRYDALLETFGGDRLPAVGFGFGDAVVMELLEERGLLPSFEDEPFVDVVAFASAAYTDEQRPAVTSDVARVATALRACKLRVDLALEPKKPKWAFKHADRRNAPYVLMLAPDEWSESKVVLKELATSEQVVLPLADVAAWIENRRTTP